MIYLEEETVNIVIWSEIPSLATRRAADNIMPDVLVVTEKCLKSFKLNRHF